MIAAVRVTRSRRSALWGLIGAAVVVALLATLPYVVYADVTDLLVNAFILLVLASMWNLLAGYCGLISVGQQAYIGVGAYTVLLLAQNGINPYLAIPFAVVVAGAIAAAIPNTWRVFTPAIDEASWSSADARIARPIAVRERKSCKPMRTTTAVTKIMRGT